MYRLRSDLTNITKIYTTKPLNLKLYYSQVKYEYVKNGITTVATKTAALHRAVGPLPFRHGTLFNSVHIHGTHSVRHAAPHLTNKSQHNEICQ